MVRSFVEAISMTEQIACSVLRRWAAEGGCPPWSKPWQPGPGVLHASKNL